MSVYKDEKRGTWYIKFQHSTRRGFKTKKEALEEESRLKLGLEVEKTTSYLFSDIVTDYLKTKKKELAYSSYCSCEEKVRRFILPNVVDKRIEEYTELDCKKFRDKIYELELSSGVKNAILNHYKGIFFHSKKYYGLTNNPTQFLEPFKKTFEEKLKKKQKELSVWNNDEFKKFITFVNDRYKPFFVVLYYTGLRLGEAMALTWNDLGNHKLIVNKSMTKVSEVGPYDIKETKNAYSVRDISLNDSLYNYLLRVREEALKDPDFSYSWFMFGGPKPLSRTRIANAKDVAIRKCNLKRITIHDFRHSHATNLINEGINIVAVSRRLGHADVAMTLKVYTHLLDKNDDILVEYLEKSSHRVLTNIKTNKKM